MRLAQRASYDAAPTCYDVRDLGMNWLLQDVRYALRGLARNPGFGLAAIVSLAGLLIRSFARLQNVAPGFAPKNVLTFDLALTRCRSAGSRFCWER
jgi:hypothetical protein